MQSKTLVKNNYSSPKISIVIPSYNKGDYIEGTLQSIFSQDYQNLEVIIQDGGSTDKSLSIIEKYVNKYRNQIVFESKKDKGQLDAINKGMQRANGELVTFINADDLYCDESFRYVSEAYLKNPRSLWFAGRGQVINSKGNEIALFWTQCKNTLLNLNSYFLLLLSSNYLSQPSIFISRKAYKKFGPFIGNTKFVFEYDLWLKIGKVQMPVVINKCLSKFRITENNISSVSYNEVFDFDIKSLRKVTSNPIFPLVHKVNNYLRILVRKLI